jgi:hypothetical protein
MNNRTTIVERTQLSKVLLRFAWLIEIFAVITGLAISLMIAVDTYSKNLLIPGQSQAVTNITNTVIAALPFVMVSIVELAKIPASQAVYQTRTRSWKFVFTVVLVFLAVITFETALNGFERNFTNLNYSVSQARVELQKNRERLSTLEEQIQRAKELNREQVIAEFDRQNKIFIDNREKSLGAVQQQESLSESKANSLQIKHYRDEIRGLIDQRKSLEARQNQEIGASGESATMQTARIENDAKGERVALRRSIAKVDNDLIEAQNIYRAEKKDCFFCGEEDARYDKKIKELNERRAQLAERLSGISISGRISDVTKNASTKRETIYRNFEMQFEQIANKISKINRQIARLSGINQSDIEKEKKRLNKRRERIERVYNENLIQISNQKDEQLEFVEDREGKIREYTVEINQLAVIISNLKSQINSKAADTQVYRIAQMFEHEAETAADVSAEMVNLVGKVWFGSLAMVIAITGILLALASEVVNDPAHTSKERSKGWLRTFRSAVSAIKQYVRHKPKIVEKEVVREVEKIVEKRVEVPVEVVKEVPVDKIVFRDVPVEIVKKEIEHVALYTNDLDLIKNKP